MPTSLRPGGLGYGGADTTRQKFTQKERDSESGLDYFGARYYSSSIGRFSNADPKPVTKESFVNPQRWNLYIYVNNNPVVAIDPDGGQGQGKGGDKVISVFLEISANARNAITNPRTGKVTTESGPDWQATKKLASKNGYKLVLFGSGEVTGEKGPPNPGTGLDFTKAVQASEVVGYVGHGAAVAGSAPPPYTEDNPFRAGGFYVGLTFFGPSGTLYPFASKIFPRPNVSASVVCNFSCNSSQRTDLFDFSPGTHVQVSIQSGPEGTTSLGTLEKALNAFVRTYVQTRGDVKKATAAAQAVIDESANPVNQGDKVVQKVEEQK